MAPDDKLVSICIPSYNHGRFLPQAIESALSQTHKNIEVVIVDDGSTDDSYVIAQQYAVSHRDVVKVFTHPGHVNRGISETVNLAFQLSRGAYWSGLPSDDVLLPHKIEKQVRFLEEHPQIGWVSGYAEVMGASGEPVSGLWGGDLTRCADPMARLLAGNCIVGTAVLARRRCLERTGPHSEGMVYSDWEWWLRMLAHHPVGFIPERLVRYRVHSYNTSLSATRDKQVQWSLEVLDAVAEKAHVIGGLLAEPRYHCLARIEQAYLCALIGQTSEATRYISAATGLDSGLRCCQTVLPLWVRWKVNECRFNEHSAAPGAVRIVLRLLREAGLARLACRLERNASASEFIAAALREKGRGRTSGCLAAAARAVWLDKSLLADLDVAALLGQCLFGRRVSSLLGRLLRLPSAV